MTRLNDLLKRKDRVREIERRDPDRFKPNPLGPGFLTRRERYTELLREIDKKIDAWIERKLETDYHVETSIFLAEVIAEADDQV